MNINLFSKIKSWINPSFIKNQDEEENFTNIKNILISSDCGSQIADLFITNLKNNTKVNKPDIESKDIIKNCISVSNNFLKPYEGHFDIEHNSKEMKVILICGINGSGKTTTTAKLGWYLNKTLNQKVLLVGCDTFRAAAKNQLKIWSQISNLDFFEDDDDIACPAALAYKAVSYAKNNNYSLVLLDTAGRLNTDIKLMKQMSKITRVLKKIDESFPTHSLIVLDANAGQNCYQQVEQFKKFAQIDGIILTKLDGSAKAGIVFGITKKYDIKIYFIGTGEKLNDIEQFKSEYFSNSLFLQK